MKLISVAMIICIICSSYDTSGYPCAIVVNIYKVCVHYYITCISTAKVLLLSHHVGFINVVKENHRGGPFLCLCGLFHYNDTTYKHYNQHWQVSTPLSYNHSWQTALIVSHVLSNNSSLAWVHLWLLTYFMLSLCQPNHIDRLKRWSPVEWTDTMLPKNISPRPSMYHHEWCVKGGGSWGIHYQYLLVAYA